MIFNLCLTFQIPARMLKLICRRKLKVKKGIANCSIFHDVIYCSQNNIYAIVSAKTKNNIFIHIAIAIKFLKWNRYYTEIICKISCICCSKKIYNHLHIHLTEYSGRLSSYKHYNCILKNTIKVFP